MLRCSCLVLSLFLFTASYSQKIPLIHSGDVISNAKILFDSSKYEEAIKEYLRVPERDTNYVYMLREITTAYIAAEQYDKVLKICHERSGKPSEYTPFFLRYQAIAEDKSGNFEKAVQLFNEAIKKYPADFGLIYNLGATYYNNKQYEKAVETFLKVLSINPFHSSTHLNLGRIAVGQGRKVHAMLAFGMYLSVAPNDNPRLVFLNNFLDNQITEEGSIPLFGMNDAEKLDQIIRAKIAMDKKFKTKVPIDAAVVRQYEMLFQQLSSLSASTNDPWMKAYLPIYKFIEDQKLAEPFIYHLLSSSDITIAKKWKSKNDKVLTGFFESVNSFIKKQRELVLLEIPGVPRPVQAWYDDDNRLDALGEKSQGEVRKGHWVFYHDNSQLSAEGDYDDTGRKKGLWKFYNNDGTIKSIENYDTGEVTIYASGGAIAEHFFLKNEVAHGEVEVYYPCGPLKEKLLYENGKKHGKGQTYHASGGVDMTYQYIADKADGEFKTFHENGNLKWVKNYSDDELSGKYSEYYPDQKIESTGEFLDGKLAGDWIYYHSNGKVARKGSYHQGKGIGEWLFYDKQGLLTEDRWLEEGVLQGLNKHYSDNKLHYVNTYKKGLFVQSIYYDRQGKELVKNGNPDGNFASKNYFPTGELRSEGSYRKGEPHGLWKYFNRYGKLVNEYQYVDGLMQGKTIEYFPSGEKKFEMEYKDDELHGYLQEFYRSGQVKQEGWFQNGIREQQWLTYFSDGTLETDSYYLWGKYTGDHRSYAQDGKLYSVSTYQNGKVTEVKNYDSKGTLLTIRRSTNNFIQYEDRFNSGKPKSRSTLLCGDYQGPFTKWYPDGTVYFTYQYQAGQRNGPYRLNNPNGQVAIEGNYVEGEEEGLWKEYYYSGRLANSGKYLNGEKDSVWNFYYPSGKLSSSIPYKDDEPHGEARYFSPEGLPLLDKLYDHGGIFSYRLVDSSGEPGPWIKFSGSGKISVANSAGTVVFEETYRDGLRDGNKKLYFDNGKLCEEYQYHLGDRHGIVAMYYANGKVREKGTYWNGEPDGKFEHYTEAGLLEKIEIYKMGSRHGKAIFSVKGAKTQEISFWDAIMED